MCPAFRLAGEGRGLPRICEFLVEAACFGVVCSDRCHLPGLTCPSARESCSPGNLEDPRPPSPPVPILGLYRSSFLKIMLLIYLRVPGGAGVSLVVESRLCSLAVVGFSVAERGLWAGWLDSRSGLGTGHSPGPCDVAKMQGPLRPVGSFQLCKGRGV